MDQEPKQGRKVKHPKKQEYYRRKRAERLAYQHKYYQLNKHMISRRMEILQLIDPEEYERIKSERSKYNAAYYRNRRRK